MKAFEADQKRLKSSLLNYVEKKPDIGEKEKKERQDVIESLKECFLLFNLSLNEQTMKFDKNATEINMTSAISHRSRIYYDNETIEDLNVNDITVRKDPFNGDVLDFDNHLNKIVSISQI